MRGTDSVGQFLIGISYRESLERMAECPHFFVFRAAGFLAVFFFFVPDFPETVVFLREPLVFFFLMAFFLPDLGGASPKISSQPLANFFEVPVWTV